MISTIGTYSAPGLIRYSWPAIEVTRKASLPYVLQTFGLFFSVSWLTLSYVATGFFYFILADGTAQLFNRLSYKWFTLILFPLIYLSMLVLFSGTIEIHYASSYYRLLGFAFTLIIPITIWITAVIRKRGVKR